MPLRVVDFVVIAPARDPLPLMRNVPPVTFKVPFEVTVAPISKVPPLIAKLLGTKVPERINLPALTFI